MELGESFMSSIYVGLHTLYRDELKVVPIKKRKYVQSWQSLLIKHYYTMVVFGFHN